MSLEDLYEIEEDRRKNKRFYTKIDAKQDEVNKLKKENKRLKHQLAAKALRKRKK